jgi:hypothetical protein
MPLEMWRSVREKPEILVGLGLVLAAGGTLHWVATGSEECILKMLDGQRPGGPLVWFTVIAGVLALLAALGAWAQRHVFREMRVRYKLVSSQRPLPYLVLFVSKQRPRLLPDEPGSIPEEGPLALADAKNGVTLERKDLLADAKALGESLAWNWEMLLRGLAPHAGVLRRLYLVGSADTPAQPGALAQPGSSHELRTAARLLAPYLATASRVATVSGAANLIKQWPTPVDFEDFEAVHSALEDIRRELDRERVGDRELCVDITGGQKPTSAAAGTFTMNKDAVLQYVQTNPPKASHVLDVRFLPAPEANE